MIFPPVEPWTDFASPAFLDAVLESRHKHTDLMALALAGEDSALESWVHERWPATVTFVDVRDLPRPGGFSAPASPEPLDYLRVAHNREMDADEHVARVASIVRGLLTNQNVDVFAQGHAYLLEGPGFDTVWQGRLRKGGTVPWRWSVEDGNHRILAQSLIGVGPYTIVRVAHNWE